MVALFATLTFTLTSCGDDDDDEPSSGNIVGTWEATNYPFGIYQVIQFSSNGKYTEVTVDPDDNETDILKGKWTQKDNKITIIEDEFGLTSTATIVKVTDKTLALDVLSLETSYKKVSDSTIDKYLK